MNERMIAEIKRKLLEFQRKLPDFNDRNPEHIKMVEEYYRELCKNYPEDLVWKAIHELYWDLAKELEKARRRFYTKLEEVGR